MRLHQGALHTVLNQILGRLNIAAQQCTGIAAQSWKECYDLSSETDHGHCINFR
jgi:hypothetical protein